MNTAAKVPKVPVPFSFHCLNFLNSDRKGDRHFCATLLYFLFFLIYDICFPAARYTEPKPSG